MDTTANAAALPSPAARSERLPDLMGCATTAIFVLSGIDLHAVALGGLWLRDIVALKQAHETP
jgi:hypothetical protein